MLIEALGATRDIGRLHAIAGVLVRHGFGDTVRRLGLADALDKAGHTLRWDHAADLARLDPPVQVRLALEELGPTFVKLGQILAGRADLFGPEWIAEFGKLHSHVPPVPLDTLRPQLREDLGDEPEAVFARFDAEPLAAASIAQVHRAALKDGTEVIVKIRRPGIVATIEADLRLMDKLATVVEAEVPALKPYRPRHLVQQFAASLRRELDFAAECRHAERVAANLAVLPDIVIPKVHWAFTHERINVQDYIDGIPGTDLARVDAAGMNRTALARKGAHAVLKMIVEDGFFHADPHPGNVFYLAGERIAFIDFGMVGRVPAQRRDELLDLLLGLVQKEPDAVADVLLDWTGGAAGEADGVRLADDVAAFVDQYHGVPLAELRLGQMLADTTEILRRHRLALPPDLALLIKAFISLEGMGRGLDPGFHMAAEALPILQQTLRARYQPKALALRAWHGMRRTASLLEQLPADLARLIRATRRGGIKVHIDTPDIRHAGERIDRAANRLTLGIVVAALIIGSSIVMTVGGGPRLLGLPAFGLLGFLGAVVGGLWLIRSIWRSQHERDDDRP